MEAAMSPDAMDAALEAAMEAAMGADAGGLKPGMGTVPPIPVSGGKKSQQLAAASDAAVAAEAALRDSLLQLSGAVMSGDKKVPEGEGWHDKSLGDRQVQASATKTSGSPPM